MNLNAVSQSLRLREYYYMLLRHKLAFLVAIVVALSGATFVAVTSPKVYKAETVLMTESDSILQPLISGLAITPSAQARMRALREQLLSWPKLTLLAEKLSLDTNAKNPVMYEALINSLRDTISIKTRGNGILSVGFEGSDPHKAQEVVKTLANIIVEGTITSTNLEANSAILFLEEQMEVYRKKLEESEKNLREFQEVYNYTLPLATRSNEQLVSLKIELQNLLIQNTELHPRVINVRKLVEQIEQQRNEQLKLAQEAGLDINAEEYTDLMSSVPLQQQMMAKLRRDYNVNNSLYQRLLSKLETAKLSQTLEESDKGLKFRVLEPARLPLKPVKPNKPLIMIAGVISGVGLGVALVWLLELSNNSIRNVDDARRLLELPIFGAIATIKADELLLGERLRAEAGV